MNLADKNNAKLHFQRFEFKYQAPLNLVEGLIPDFLKYMSWDPYARDLPAKSYAVSSLYFDSAGLGCYYQNLNGDRVRKKLRIRFYDLSLKPEMPVFLEIKRKYDMVSVKDRLTMTQAKCYNLLQGKGNIGLSFSEHNRETLDEFLWLKYYNGMQPRNMVIYDRKPLISKVDPNFRVTIDYNIRTYSANWLCDKKDGISINPGWAVLEVKFNNILPFWFHQLILRHNLERRPFSKYCRSMEACRPELIGGIKELHLLQLENNLTY